MKHHEKSVSKQEFERIAKKFPAVQVRKFQASLNEESYFVRWVEGQKKPYDLVHLFKASF